MTDREINTSRKQQVKGSWARYCLYQDILSDSHDVILLIDGAQAFPSMIEAKLLIVGQNSAIGRATSCSSAPSVATW